MAPELLKQNTNNRNQNKNGVDKERGGDRDRSICDEMSSYINDVDAFMESII